MASRITGLLFGTSVLALSAGACFAQSAQTSGTASDQAQQDSGPLEAIVVTAQKRTENLQHASVAVQAVLPVQIEQQGIRSSFDLQTLIPALKFERSQVTVPTIRGVGTFNNVPGVDPSVAYSIDGIYMTHYPALPPILFDIARVEAVLGPQGTLYGRNSNGGAVNVLTNNPTHESEGNVSLQLGNYAERASDAMINVPISDTVALRIAGAYNEHDPYSDDGFNDLKAGAARIKLALDPSEDLKIILSLDGSWQNDHGVFQSVCPPNSNRPGCAGVPWQPRAGWGTRDTNAAHSFGRIRNLGVTSDIEYSFEWATLTSLTGFHSYDVNDLQERPNAIQIVPYTADDRLYTQEFRLTSLSSSPLAWVTGLYYSHERQEASFLFKFNGLPGQPLNGQVIPDGLYTSSAAFGDLTYSITDALRLRTGLRFTHEEKDAFGFTYAPAPLTVPTGGNASEDRVTWKFGADYDLSPDHLLYATISNGFKSGGVNQVSPTVTPTLPTSYEPETVVATELGSKNAFANGALQVNLSAFNYDYKNFQTVAGVLVSSGRYFPTVNSQKARFYGSEISLRAALSDADRLDLTGTFLHAKLTEFVVPLAGINNSGHDAANTPRFTAGLTYGHTFFLNNSGSIECQLSSAYVAHYFADISNIAGSRQDSYTRSSASISYDTGNSGWKTTAYIRNIEDEAAITSWNAPPPGALNQDTVYVDPPRTFGVSVRKKF